VSSSLITFQTKQDTVHVMGISCRISYSEGGFCYSERSSYLWSNFLVSYLVYSCSKSTLCDPHTCSTLCIK